jgi:hypothetical protein
MQLQAKTKEAKIKMILLILLSFMVTGVWSPPAFSFEVNKSDVGKTKGFIYKEVPDKVEPGEKYLFYLHGAWPERHGLNEAHPQFGLYRYDMVAKRFSQEGFRLIFKARLKPVKAQEYAEKIAKQVQQLTGKGVPAENIYIMGHSKGAFITFVAAGLLNMEKLNVIILAGCAKSELSWSAQFKELLKKTAPTLKGRFLSLYDESDRNYGSCKYALSMLPDVNVSETAFHTGKGHGLFYEPHDNWVGAVTKWAGMK